MNQIFDFIGNDQDEIFTEFLVNEIDCVGHDFNESEVRISWPLIAELIFLEEDIGETNKYVNHICSSMDSECTGQIK